MVACIGPFATINYEPRQTWKGAAVIANSCAEVWLILAAANLPKTLFFKSCLNSLILIYNF